MNITEHDAKNAVRTILLYLGEDPDREGLKDTPSRVIKAWDEMTEGYGLEPKTILATAFQPDGYDEMVLCRDIEFHSTCEHHMLPFSGVAHVAYVPSTRVVGLSKMARLVDCFARRLQIQERLTRQIADTMQSVLKPKGVGVIIQARHLCMACRGVIKQRSVMVTSALLGVMRHSEARNEFLSLVK